MIALTKPNVQSRVFPWETDTPGLSSMSLYLGEIADLPRLTHEEERQLALRIKDGDAQAKQEMIEANLKLVVSIAKRYGTRNMDLLDHIQNGSFGLVKAVERFDPERNIHFATYACHWIRQAVTRSQAFTSRLVRLPIYIQTEICALDKAYDEWFLAHGTEPTVEHLATSLHVEIAHIHLLQSMRGRALSLDKCLGSEDDNTFLACTPDKTAESSFEEVDDEDEQDRVGEQIRQALGVLTEQERTVITLSFGLDGGEERTLAEVGRMMGVSRERVRQVQSVAIRKLQREPRLLELFKGEQHD